MGGKVSKAVSNKFQIADRGSEKPVLAEVKRLAGRLFAFGDFVLDAKERTLTRGSEQVALTNKSFDILQVLVENHGRLVTKDHLLGTVWPDTYVEEKTLAQNVFTLRKTLGTGGNAEGYIETVPKHGYRFRAEVSAVPPTISFDRAKSTPVTPESPARTPNDNQTAVSEKRPAARGLWTEHKRAIAWSSALILGGLAAIVGLAFFSRHDTLARRAFQKVVLSRLTNTGNITAVAMSSDRRFVAYAARTGDKESLFLRQIDPTTVLEIVPAAPVNFRGMTFGPDGKWIYYVTTEPDKHTGTLYRVSLLGGAAEQVMPGAVDSRITFSPDGTQFAFLRWSTTKENALFTASIDGTKEKQLATLGPERAFGSAGPAWSPNGAAILSATQNTTPGGHGAGLIAIDVATASVQTLPAGEWNWIGQVAWLGDGSGFVFTAWNPESETMSDQIWLMSYPGGERRRVTSDINGYLGVDLAEAGDTIVASESMPDTAFWSMPSGGGQPVKLSAGAGELYTDRLGLAAIADTVIFGSRQSGVTNLWRLTTNGSAMQLFPATGGIAYQPAIARDGTFVVFVSDRTGLDQLWRVDPDGSKPQLLTPVSGVRSPSVTSDGKWVFFEGNVPGDPTIWRVDARGGPATKVFPDRAFLPAVAPDGKTVACLLPSDDPMWGKLALISVVDGKIQQAFDRPVPRTTPALRWSPDGRAVAYVVTRNGVSNIWSQPVDGGEPQPLSRWTSESITRFDWAPNGALVFERGIVLTDLILIRNQSVDR